MGRFIKTIILAGVALLLPAGAISQTSPCDLNNCYYSTAPGYTGCLVDGYPPNSAVNSNTCYATGDGTTCGAITYGGFCGDKSPLGDNGGNCYAGSLSTGNTQPCTPR